MYACVCIGSVESDWEADSGRPSADNFCSIVPRDFDASGRSLGGMYLLVAKELVCVCVYVCMYVRTRSEVYVCMYVCMYVRDLTCIYVCTRSDVCEVCMYVCLAMRS